MRGKADEQIRQTSQTALFYGDRDKVNKTLEEIRQYSTLKSQQIAAEQLLDDPSIFNYDDFVDKNAKAKAQVIENKKKQQQNFQSRYMADIITAAEQRKFNQSVYKDKVEATRIQRESERFGTNEVYVTSAYKKKMDDAKKIEEIEKLQEEQERLNEANRDSANSNFYKNLYLNSQFAGGDRGIQAEKDGKSHLQRKIERIMKEKQQTQKDALIKHNIIPLEQEKQKTHRSRSRSRSVEKKGKEHKQKSHKEKRSNEKKSNETKINLNSESKNQQINASKKGNKVELKDKAVTEQIQEIVQSQQPSKEQKLQSARERYLQRKQNVVSDVLDENNNEKDKTEENTTINQQL